MQCNFSPYEGNEKFIFVSYSHQNGHIVAPILERMNKEGFRIWYDEGIEWGTEWPKSIGEHLKACEVCMAFHSKDSSISPNCRQEVYYALKKRKEILSVYLEEVELDEGMDMQLSPLQSTYYYQYEEKEMFFEKLINTKVLQSCKGEVSENILAASAESENRPDSYSFDGELNRTFQERLELLKEKEENMSPLAKKIAEAKKRKFAASLFLNTTETEDLSADDGYDDLSDCFFTFSKLPDYTTTAFKVCKKIDFRNKIKVYECQPLEVVEGERDGLNVVMYHITNLEEEGNPIILCHFNQKNKEAFIHMGFCIDGTVYISDKPSLIPFQMEDFEVQTELSPSLFQKSGGDENQSFFYQEKSSMKEEWRETSIEEAKTVLIDPETAEVVKREIYYDETAEQWKARIKIIPGKKYFAFQVKSTASNDIIEPLSDMETAGYYEKGRYGFPKDLEKAALYYEKAGTAEAFYKIAMIFKNNESFQDEDIYKEYIKKAADMGHEKASACLISES